MDKPAIMHRPTEIDAHHQCKIGEINAARAARGASPLSKFQIATEIQYLARKGAVQLEDFSFAEAADLMHEYHRNTGSIKRTRCGTER